MKRFASILIVSAAAILSSRLAYGFGCDNVSPCVNPGVAGLPTLANPTITVSQITSLQIKNSSSPATANDSGTWYWFFATSITAPNTATGSSDFNPDLQGFRVKASNLADLNSSPVSSDLLPNGKVLNLRAGTTYNLYAQACQPDESNPVDATKVLCSDWVSVFPNKTTLVLPAAPFNTVTKVNVSSGSLNVRTTVPDITEVQSASMTIHNAQGLGVADTILSGIAYASPFAIGYAAAPQSFPAAYPWIPNTQYTFLGQLVYPHIQMTNTQTVAAFWTNPADPGVISVSNITHCSAQVTVVNGIVGAPAANPSYTDYKACLVGTAGSCITQKISGTGLQGDTTAYTFLSLNSGTPYTSNVTALNENAAWNDSNPTSGPGVLTQSWGAVTVSGLWNSSATLDTSGLIGAVNITTWSVSTTPPLPAPLSALGSPPGTITLTGLTPNTQYAIRITLQEVAGCQNTLVVASSTTLATIPQAFDIGTNVPTQATAAWTTNGNSVATTYQIQYSTVAAFASNNSLQTTAANAVLATITSLTPEFTYFAHVRALKVTGGVDSAYSNTAQVTMPNQGPTVPAPVCTFNAQQTLAFCADAASDNGGTAHLVYHWSVAPAGASISSTNDQLGVNTATVTITTAATYTVTVKVTDHDGAGLFNSNSTTIGPIQVASSIQLTPTNPIVGRGQSQGIAAAVTDFAGNPIAGAAVDWSLDLPAAGSVSPVRSAATTFTAGNTVGSFTVFASSNSASTSTPVAVEANSVIVTTVTDVIGSGGTTPVSMTVIKPQGGAATFNAASVRWSVSGCPVGNNVSPATGGGPVNFSAGGQPGPCLITVTDGFGDVGTASILVSASSPTFVSGPSATNVFPTSAALSMKGSGFDPETSFIYSWTLVSPAGAAVEFSTNTSYASQNAVATFHQAGIFTIRAKILDNVNKLFVEQDFGVVIGQVLTGVTVSPSNVTLQTLANQSFTATGADQFTGAMPISNVTWSQGSGSLGTGGTINYTAPASLGQTVTITALSGAVSGVATVNVVSFDVSDAHPFPVPCKASLGCTVAHFMNLGSSSQIKIFAPSGREVFSVDVTGPTYDWHLINSSSEKIASGVYFYQVKSPQGKKDGKLVIIR